MWWPKQVILAKHDLLLSLNKSFNNILAVYFSANYGYTLRIFRFNFTLWHCCGYGLVGFSYKIPLVTRFGLKYANLLPQTKLEVLLNTTWNCHISLSSRLASPSPFTSWHERSNAKPSKVSLVLLKGQARGSGLKGGTTLGLHNDTKDAVVCRGVRIGRQASSLIPLEVSCAYQWNAEKGLCPNRTLKIYSHPGTTHINWQYS